MDIFSLSLQGKMDFFDGLARFLHTSQKRRSHLRCTERLDIKTVDYRRDAECVRT